MLTIIFFRSVSVSCLGGFASINPCVFFFASILFAYSLIMGTFGLGHLKILSIKN